MMVAGQRVSVSVLMVLCWKNILELKMKEELRRVRESSERLGATIAEWERKFGSRSTRPNETYQKIDDIAAYLNYLRNEFPDQTVSDLIMQSPRAVLERKYAQLLLLSQQLIDTPNYILGKENGNSY
jgi:hypothetical protein